MGKPLFLCAFAVVCVALGCVSKNKPSDEVVLVKNGAPLAGIVVDGRQPTRSAQFAAFELQHVVKLMTGSELPIVGDIKDVKGIPILVGESDATRRLKIPADAFKGEEYLVESDKRRIVLLGNDSPEYGKVDYANFKTFPKPEYNYHSTMFAVYDFLEKCCGVRFYSFGDDGIAFESRPTLAVKPLSIRFTPKMDAYRQLYFGDKTSKMPPRDVQLLQLRWRLNTVFGVANHMVYSIYWRYWGKAVSPNLAKLFIEKRPEYFAQGYAGTFAGSSIRRQYPNDPDLPPQLCATSQGTVEYFADEAFKVYNGERVEGGYANNIPRMPGKPWFYPIQEDDSSAWCKCGKCQGSFSEIDPKLRYGYLHFDWVNRIAEAAAKRDPAIGITTCAYSGTLPYPDPKTLKLRPNVAVEMCLGVQSWYHPGVYAWQHKAYKDWVNNEVSKRPLLIWAYMLCPAHEAKIIYKYNQFFPVLYPWHAGRITKEFARDGVRGWFCETDVTFHLLEAYVSCKMCFDPSADVDQLLDEYFTSYYGGAAEPMRRFCKTIEDITWNPDNYPPNAMRKVPESSFTYGIHTERTNWHLGTPERIAALQEIIGQAERQAATPLERQRVKWFVDNVWAQAVEGRKAFEAREKVRAVPVPCVTADYAGERGGDLGKVDFDKAAKSGGWTTIDGGRLDTKPALSFASDSGYLYIRYHEDGDTAFRWQKADLWKNNVEIFLAAQPDYPYGQLALAPNGEFKALRHLVVEGTIRMDDWTLKPVIKNQLNEKGWTFSMAIPLKQLLPDRGVAPGDGIYANFMRTQAFAGGTLWAWSPVFAGSYAQGLYRMGRIFLAPLPQEGALPVNGEFKPCPGGLPEGWTCNKAKEYEPYGTIKVESGQVDMTSAGKRVCMYSSRIFPARRGDQIVLEFMARGKGNGGAGAYFCSGGGDGAGSRLEEFPVDGEARKHRISLTVANLQEGRFVAGFRPVLAAAPGSKVEYSQLKVYVTARGEQP